MGKPDALKPLSRQPEALLWTLATAGGVSLLAAVSYLYAATRFVDRGAGRDRTAARAFALWWGAIALYTGAQGIEDLMGAAGATPLALFVAWRYASLVVYSAGLAGLAAYVLYVRTGSARWPLVVVAYYAVLTVFVVALAASGRPTGVSIQTWRTDLTYDAPTTTPLLTIVLLLILLPVLGAIGSYLDLRRRAQSRSARIRITIVGASMATWLVATAVSRASNNDWLQLFARPILGALVAIAVVLAFRRPPDVASNASDRASARDALMRRVRDLV